MNNNESSTAASRLGLNGLSGSLSRFPEIIVDARGAIILCPGCRSSNATRQDTGAPDPSPLYICNDCGSIWRQS